MLNSTLVTSAKKIMNNTSAAQFTITARFFNSNSFSDFNWFPFRIDQLVMIKDFLENWGDVINLQFILSPKDYALLQDQGQDLLCMLTLTYVDMGGKIVYTPAPVQRQYHVVINDPRDVRMAIPDIHAYTEPSMTLTVQLMEETIYKLRHCKINTVYQNTTVTGAIHALTQGYGITRLHLVPPDNDHYYDHIDIHSYQGVDSVFGYLQTKCGLYTKGSNSYITDGVLYIYPPFETKPIYDKTAIFYQVGTGDYAGSQLYHRIENKSISIVVNSQPHSYDLSIAGSENIGTGFVFNRASRLTNGYTALSSQSGAAFTDNPSLSVNLDSSRTIAKGFNNVFHIPSTDNPFPAMSKIISHQASLMQVTWMNADPFQIDPGHAVSYNYDQNQVMVSRTGIVESAKYSFTRVENVKAGSKDMFSAVGELILRLAPNVSQVFS